MSQPSPRGARDGQEVMLGGNQSETKDC